MDIKRGDIFLVNFNPSRGSEQAGYRPAVVIQNNIGNKYSSATIVAAITAAVDKIYPFMVRLSAGEGGLEKESAVNLAQILTIDKVRLERKLGTLSSERVSEVDAAIKLSLGL